MSTKLLFLFYRGTVAYTPLVYTVYMVNTATCPFLHCLQMDKELLSKRQNYLLCIIYYMTKKTKPFFLFFSLFVYSHERTNLYYYVKGRISKDLTPIFTENNVK